MAPIRSAPAFLVYYESSDEAAVTIGEVEAKLNWTRPVEISLTLPKRAPEAYPLLFDPETEIEATAGTATLVRNRGQLLVRISPPSGGFVSGDIELNFTNRNAGDGELPPINGKLKVK